ncbi:zinc-ribbon domain-containing protein [Bosea sp. (in: a-proteobacteria)]|uniref:zinc-ribbon domain-containing protein n=1 Tax=Bosea sp. (in: a-proteobacteria) TaxID=1871050 RepID=UPI002733A8BD|nr:zinc-ribbon domain-containing protein [Bosea sp. (in: a-proteobacteria)]MDP3408630.1 DUF3426 domain-containing protein [Bosea sp. (in: a-proteobacteria)]
MLIVCPSCASRYELDGAKLGPDGRKVRCASCQTLWHVAPEPDLPPAPSAEETQAMLNEELERAAVEAQAAGGALPSDADAPAVDADAPQPRSKRHGGRPARKPRGKAKTKPPPAVVIAATLSLTGIVLLGGLFWQRDLAVSAAPQLAAVFEALGYDVNVRGLKLGDVESGLVEDEMGRFLIVEGDVTNITRSNTRVPPIEVAVKDAAGQTLYSWQTDPPRQELQPSELMRFRARLASPPAAGQSVLVRFAASGAPPAGAARN